MRNRQLHGEEGSALVLALAMLTVVGLIIGGALTYAGTSLRASNEAVRPNRTSLYAADSAIQTAIQNVKRNPLLGTEPVPGVETCPKSTFTYPSKAGNVDVRVCPQKDSFVPRGRTRAVLLTLAPLGGPAGLSKQGGSSGQLVIRGDAWINSSVANNGSGGITVVSGRLFARGACPDPITVTAPGTKNCNLGNGPTPPISQDPNYAPATSTMPAPPAPSTCDPAAKVLTLQPGSYDQALFDAAMKTCAKPNVIVLAPGATDAPAASTYYFHDMTMPSGEIVAGSTSATLLTNSFGHRCDDTGRGVQLVFGANATMDQGPGDEFEACGFNLAQRGGSVDNPRIVLFGLKNDVGTMKQVCATPGCDVIIRTHGSGGSLHLAGTVYMPTADLDLQVTNQSVEAVSDALISYTVALSTSSSIGTMPSIGGGGGESSNGDVVFDAYINGTSWISSRVEYTNGGLGEAATRSWVIKR